MPLHLFLQCFFVGVVCWVEHASIWEIHLLYFLLELCLHVIFIVRLRLLEHHLIEHLSLALCSLLLDEVSHRGVVVLHFDKVVFGAVTLNSNMPVFVNSFVLTPDKLVLVPEAFNQLHFDEEDPDFGSIPDLFIDRVHLHVNGYPVCEVAHYLSNYPSLISGRAVSDSHVFDLLVQLGLCGTMFVCLCDDFSKFILFFAVVVPVVLVEIIFSL